MASFPCRAGFRLVIMLSIALAMLVSPLALSGRAVAQEALYPGAAGLVANTGGQPVLLRETPSFEAMVVSSFPEGTPAKIIEGPVSGADGTAWYGVAIGGVTGYIVAGYLTPDSATVAPVATEPAPVAAPVETLAAEAPPVDADAAPAPAAVTAASPVATADLNLRAEPSYEAMVLGIVPAGTALMTTGESAGDFAGVTYNGQAGWVDSGWLGAGPAAPVPAPGLEPDAVLLQEAVPDAAMTGVTADDAALVSDLTAPAGQAAAALGTANLRLGPSAGDEILRVLPAGAAVTVTGASANGWTPVWYNGTWGFISADLLGANAAVPVSMAQEALPAESMTVAAPATDSGAAEMLATTLSDVNLRAAPETTAPILTAIPAGIALTPLAGPESGFYQVAFNGQTGWVSGEYLDVSASYLQRGDRRDRDGKVEGSEPAGNVESGAGGIIWPVSGGSWSIMQGYNGSSHQNQDGLWQYYYSLDLVRDDGNTAGQTVYSPVNGVVRWTDPSSGGMSIDMGDGHAVAMYHVTFDGRFQAGSEVAQGQPIGQISGSGGAGYAGSPHLHFTLWTSDDNGNWDRSAVPFTGKYAISGMDFPDTGGSQQHRGTTFSP